MKKILLLFYLLLLPVLASAAVVQINGIYYELDETNKVAKVTYKDIDYNSYSGTVIIPETVKYGGKEYSVTEINNYAFLKCSNLTNVTISNTVTTIGEFAFSDCSQLSSITIGTGVTTIGINAFRNCNSLTYVHIQDLAAWCNISFKWIYLTERIDNSNPLIFAHHLYLNGKEIKTLTIPNSVTTIKQAVFQGCTGLTSVTIHNGVTSIGRGAFQGCTNLIFANFPSSITTIDDGAFQGCSSLSTVTIPNGVTSIGDGAFHSCSSLTTLTLGANITNIGSLAFKGCSSLKNVYCHATAVPTTGYYAFNEIDVKNAVLNVPTGTVDAYNNTAQWKLFKAIVEIDAPTYSLIYKVDGNEYKTYKLQEGAAITPEPTPTKEGYKFSGWSYIPKTMPAEDVTIIGLFEKLPEEVINISDAKQATWCSNYDLDFTNVKNIKAYIATGYNRISGTIWLNRVYEVPAGTGILLVADQAKEYRIPHKTTATYYVNMLVGCLNAQTINEKDGNYTNYYLSNGTSGVGFYRVDGQVSLSANRAYLPLLKDQLTSNTRCIGLEFIDDENTTRISNPSAMQQPDIYYNLQGQRVDNPTKGLYIRNGKKVIIR